MSTNYSLLDFNPFHTPKVILQNIITLSRGFAIPYLTVTFSPNGGWVYATKFEENGKQKTHTFNAPRKTDEFISKITEILPSFQNHLVQ